MSKGKLESICRLCGDWAEMTKEHIPPKKAFNNNDRLFHTITHTVYQRGPQKFRGGVGIYTLCGRCNNKTGGDYGQSYVEWAKQGIEWLEVLQVNEVDDFTFTIQPLNVLKQVCTMAIAMMSPNAIDKHEELRRFVLNRESKELPIKYAVFAYMTTSNKPRLESEVAVLNLHGREAIYVYAEVTFPPFGFCVIPCKSLLPPEEIRKHKLYPIDWYTYYEYDETATVQLRLPRLSVNTQFPLDYRTEEEVVRQAVEQEHLSLAHDR